MKLDIGCGWSKRAGFVGMDKRNLPGVDIIHDLEIFPYPIPLVFGSFGRVRITVHRGRDLRQRAAIFLMCHYYVLEVTGNGNASSFKLFAGY